MSLVMEKHKKYRLKPFLGINSFFMGMGSVMNISGDYFENKYPEMDDAKAIESDWRAIGRDFERVTDDFEAINKGGNS